MSEQETLVALMKDYQSGSKTAFRSLYEALKPKLRQYLISKTFDASHADDLLQETFLQIHRSRATYLPGKPVSAWAFGIARYVFLMDRRTRTRKFGREVQTESELPETPILGEMEKLGDADLIRRALPSVPEKLREPLLLHHVWGFSFSEIGSLIGTRPGTAKVRAFRGLQALRKALAALHVTEWKPRAN